MSYSIFNGHVIFKPGNILDILDKLFPPKVILMMKCISINLQQSSTTSLPSRFLFTTSLELGSLLFPVSSLDVFFTSTIKEDREEDSELPKSSSLSSQECIQAKENMVVFFGHLFSDILRMYPFRTFI